LDPRVDAGLRSRLVARFGAQAEPWLAALPAELDRLAQQWGIAFGPPIPRGSMSAVFRCRTSDGQDAVLKASPDRERLAVESAALSAWDTVHSPAVIAVDDEIAALLVEAIEPGTPLVVSSSHPTAAQVAALMAALHESGTYKRSWPTVADRIDHLFASSTKLYEWHPELVDLIPRDLYDHGWERALQLAQDDLPTVLLHGDLTPSNILDGGAERGLVAIDPAPCIGDAAFDAVDLLVWQAEDLATIETRADRLAAASGLSVERLNAWCVAFAGMCALEAASNGAPADAFARLARRG
jgi:streptomycin 6-kinase